MLKWTVRKRLGEETTRSRRSFGDVLNNDENKARKLHKRRSLGSHLNSEKIKIDKENHFATPTRRKNPRNNSTPLSDRGNLIEKAKSPSIFKFAPTLPTFDVEYSPMHKQIVTDCCDELPAKRMRLDFMDLSYEFKPTSASTSSPTSTPLVTRRILHEKCAPVIDSDSSLSMNSSEVGENTLQKMIDSILESARHGKKFSKRTKSKTTKKEIRDRNANFMANIDEEFAMEQKSIERLLSSSKIAQAAEKTIIIAGDAAGNEREVKSPAKIGDEECQLKRQNAVRRKNTCNGNEKINKKKSEEESRKTEKEFQDSSTDQKCLSFSSANFDDLSDKFKRSSVASNSSSSSNSCVSQSKFTKNLLMKGSLEVSVTTDENRKKILVHVLKCKNLQRFKDITNINAYVKCALVPSLSNSLCNHQNIYQRTAVHKPSNDPFFDHKFIFDIDETNDLMKNLQLAVWHRDKTLKRSEFIGCLTFSVENILSTNIQGSYMLQPQSAMTKSIPMIIESCEEKTSPIIENEEINPDDNLVLKFLELSNFSTFCNSKGRTPFTITAEINRQSDNTFGFEISWSKPPKIKSVRNSHSLLLPGDFIIFVGEQNVVTMTKEKVIELIRNQGDNLTLEIYRSSEKTSSNEIISRLASQETPTTSSLSLDNLKKKAIDLSVETTPKSSKTCQFKQPQVYFTNSVGKGVIV